MFWLKLLKILCCNKDRRQLLCDGLSLGGRLTMVSLQEVIMLKISDDFRCTNVETLNSGVWLGSLPADLLTKLVHMSDEHDTTEVI